MSPRSSGRAPADAVAIREVGPRDGLQILRRVLPTAHKQAWIEGAYAAGIREIEVGSFVPTHLMPQMADTAELVAFSRGLPGLVANVLVPNLKGAQRAFDCGAQGLLVPLSASHAHSLANLKRTPDEVLGDIERIVALRDAQVAAGAPACRIDIGISTAFGCTLQGAVPVSEVLRLVKAVDALGVDEIGLADTVGYADPLAVKCLYEACIAAVGHKMQCAHFHDTRGLGLANAFAAWQCGIRRFDASLASLGGCPHAPGASGNVATEDLVYLFASMGVPTGIDYEALLEVRARLGQWLPGEALRGHIVGPGLPKTLLQPEPST
jgi:hydroxymethylglutaryl-CoA lyase